MISLKRIRNGEKAPKEIQAKSADVALGGHRTNIEAISSVGYELSEEHLRLVSGSRPSAGTTSDLATDDD